MSPSVGSAAVVALLCTAQFVVVLDVTIVAVALPAIRHSLGFTPEGLQWVLSAYTLAFGGLLVVAGRAGDAIGRRLTFAAGLVVFGAASLVCGLASSPAALVAARAVQGVGAAMEAPAALALLTNAFPEPADRRRAVAWWTAAAAGGGASGWVLGGVLVEAAGWPTVFLVNVPLCLAGAALAPRILEESRAGRLARLDLGGAVAVTAGLALLVLGLTRIEAAGVSDPTAGGALAAAAVALAAFARIERRAADPILPPWALRRPGFVAAVGTATALTGATTSAMFLAILYQQDALHRPALETGLWCAPFNLAVIAGSALAPRVGARLPARAVMARGLGTVAAGAAVLIALSPAGLLPAFALMGAGLGCASVASTASGTAALPAGAEGVASGVLNAAAQVGSALGLALVVTIAAAGYRTGFAGAAAVALAAALLVGRSAADRARLTRSRRTSRRRRTTRRR